MKTTLSGRENEVLSYFDAGYRVSDIAELLGKSIKTISTYRTRMRRKLGLTEPVSNEAIVEAAKLTGCLQPEVPS